MAPRQLSLTLNVDAGQFTSALKSAGVEVKAFKSVVDGAGAAVKAARDAMTGSVSSAERYAAAIAKAGSSKASLKSAQDAFIQSLVKEYQTMGMTNTELARYSAAQLQVTTVTKGLISAIQAKAVAQAAEAATLRESAALAERIVAADEERATSAAALIKTLRDQVLVLAEGTEALGRQEAAALGVGEVYDGLVAQIEKLTAAQTASANAMREEAASATEMDAILRGLLEAEDETAIAAERMLSAIREQIVVVKEGHGALMQQRADALGIGEAYAIETSILERATAAKAAVRAADEAAAKAARDAAEANRTLSGSFTEVTAHATGSSRAIREFSVITHEISSGRIRQAIGSFQILLQQMGAIGPAAIGIGLAVGLLYGIARPIEEAAKNFETLNRQAMTLGVSTGFLQTLGVASQELGVKTDGLVGGMGRLDAAFARARAGTKLAEGAFKSLGVSTKDNYTNEQLIQAVLKGWNGLDDGPHKVAVAMALFGRSGKDLIPILDSLSKNYDAIQAKAIAYGVVNENAVRQGILLATSFNDAGVAMTGLATSMMGLVGGALNSTTGGFTRLVVQFSAFLREQSTIDGFNNAMKVMGQTFGVLGQAAGILATYFPVLIAGVAGWASVSTGAGFAATVALGAAFEAVRLEALGLSASFVIATSGASALEIAEGVLAVSTAGLGVALRGTMGAVSGLMGLVGGPLVVGLMAAAAAFAFFGDAANTANNASKDFRSSQVASVGAIQQAMDYATKYKINTDGLTAALNSVTGASGGATSAAYDSVGGNNAAAAAAMARAKAEQFLTYTMLNQAGVDAQKEAAKQNTAGKHLKLLADIDPYTGGSPDSQNALYKQSSAAFKGSTQQSSLASTMFNLGHQVVAAKPTVTSDAPGTTAGDPAGTPHAAKKTPADRLQEEIDKLKGQVDSTNVFETTDDPVAAAKQQMSDRLNHGEFAGITPDSDLGKKAIDMAGQAAAAKASGEIFKQVWADYKKGLEEATVAWANFGKVVSPEQKKVDDFDAKVDAQTAAFLKLNPTLDASTAGYKKLMEAANGAKEAFAEAQLLDIASSEKAKTKDINDDIDFAKGKRTNGPLQKGLADVAQARADALALFKSSMGNTDAVIALLEASSRADDHRDALVNQLIVTDGLQNKDARDKMLKNLEPASQASADVHADNVTAITNQYQPQIADATKAGASAAQIEAIQKNMDAALLNEQLRYNIETRTPIQEMVQQWQDATKEMQTHSKTWMDDFITQMEAGKFNFKTFAMGIAKDWADTELKAEVGGVMGKGFDALGSGLTGIASKMFAPLNKLAPALGPQTGLSAGADGSMTNPFWVQMAGGLPGGTPGMAGGAGANSIWSQLFTNVGSMIGGGGAAAAAASEASFGDLAGLFHTGGIVGGPSSMTRVSPSWFNGAPRYHTGGIAGLQPNEVPAILQQGEGVFTQNQMAAMTHGNGAAPVAVNINNESGMPMGGTQSGSSFDGEKYVINVVMDHLSKAGPLRNAMNTRQ